MNSIWFRTAFWRGPRRTEAISDWVSRFLLEGIGLEIGALAHPKPIPPSARVIHIDRLPRDLRGVHYPEVDQDRCADPDIIGDGGRLDFVRADSVDFVIASHVIEHLPDPLGALRDWLKVLKPGGRLLLVVPDKRHTFDSKRPRTTLGHLLKDMSERPTHIHQDHYLEWATHVEDLKNGQAQDRAGFLSSMEYSVHAHAWIDVDVDEMLEFVRSNLQIPFQTILRIPGAENTYLIQKPLRRTRQSSWFAGTSWFADIGERAATSLALDGIPATMRKGLNRIRRRWNRRDPYELWLSHDRKIPKDRVEPYHDRNEDRVEPYHDRNEDRVEGLRDRGSLQERVESVESPPRISVLTPVLDPDPEHLLEAIESVQSQTYPCHEMILIDDASSRPLIRCLLKALARRSNTKLLVNTTHQGIARSSQRGLMLATGTHLALLDHDDRLHEHALAEVATRIRSGADFVYTDEDKLDHRGVRINPHFKPGWSPSMLLSAMYTGHLSVYERLKALEIGGFRHECEGSQDFDMALRMSEVCRDIRHVPRVLYHWRMVEGSEATAVGAKPWVRGAAIRALTDTLVRRKIKGVVEPGLNPVSFRIRYKLTQEPLVSIIVPTRDRPELLQACVAGVLERSSYQRVELIIVDNDSRDPAACKLLDDLSKREAVRIVRAPGPFNFSRLVNLGAAAASGEFYLLLNNDVIVSQPEWLNSLLEIATQPDVGIVGACLLFPFGIIQHAGITLGLGGVAGNSFWKQRIDDPGLSIYSTCIREVSAVTGACMLVRRDAWEGVGGFDETRFAVAFNDVDFCLRVGENGYRTVYTPFARLEHFESSTRERVLNSAEVEHMLKRWGHRLKSDPHYNSNLTRDRADFSIRRPGDRF